MPGGHIEFGENIAEGLKREVKEEFGMDITVGDPFFVYDYINQVKGAHAVEIVYFTRFAGPTDDIHLNPEDHSEYGWFAEADLSKVSRAVDHAHVGGVSPHSDPEFDAIERAFEILRGGRHKVV